MEYDELTRKKIDFVFKGLLLFHEQRTKNTVDLPAFEYARRDIENVIQEGRLDNAYRNTKELLKGLYFREKRRRK